MNRNFMRPRGNAIKVKKVNTFCHWINFEAVIKKKKSLLWGNTNVFADTGREKKQLS